MVSSVKEKDIKKLREAGYLATEIAHRLPAKGQIVPIPEPHERVVFLTHFVRGLGFPLHPFVRGLMFYYGLDFHDLAPNSILNISAFIVVCEAFLCIAPHFGLWLKTFNVKPKVVTANNRVRRCHGGQDAQCTWHEGSFLETVKGWQSGWFYIIEPRNTNWAAAPEFRSRVPMRLTSWQERGLTWGPSDELTGLQTCVQNMINKKIKLVNMIQVMLVRRILPCQHRTCYLWECDPAKH